MSTQQTTDNTTERKDIYTRVTDAIVAAIESGAGQYRMPWQVRQDKGFSPLSISTCKPYRGVNTLVLWAQAQSKGYSSSLWGTYQNWAAIGGQVRKGEHGSPVVYWGSYEDKARSEVDDGDGKRHLFCKGYTVFNLNQVDGVTLPKKWTEPKLSANERIEAAEQFLRAVGAPIWDGGNRAFYRPTTPEGIYLPSFEQFPEAEQYYSVAAHELTHWTSHESRLDRQLGKRFGSEEYAVEELIAELGSAYTMARLELELTPRTDHAAYIQSWLQVLRNDKRAIFTAASAAQKAADYLSKRAGQGVEQSEGQEAA